MPNGDRVLSTKEWSGVYGGVLVILAVLLLWGGLSSKPVVFRSVDRQLLVDVLAPLFVIALFLERAQEVFISAWRDMGRKPLKTALRSLKNDPNASAADLRRAEDALAAYRSKTGRISFLALLSAGVIIGMVGVRAIEPFVDLAETGWGGTQENIFVAVDIVLTGGLIGGGSDGIHKLMSVATDFLDETRRAIKQRADQPAPSGGP